MDKLSQKWKGIKVGRREIVISHLMFADDLLLIFEEVDEKHMHCVMKFLREFGDMSEQEVSHEKTSILFSKNVTQDMQTRLLQIYNFRVIRCFGKYLGVPISGKKPRKLDLQYILDQVAFKLNSWKRNCLSLAGRITLAKSVIQAIPLYSVMTNMIPKSRIDDIHKLQRKFIWGDNNDKKRIHAIGWDTLTKLKELGGALVSSFEKKISGSNGMSIGRAKGTDSSIWRDITDNLCGARVCGLVDHHGEWNIDILHDWLPAHWIDKIRSCVPPCEGETSNVFYFAGTGDGNFSVREMFREVKGYKDRTIDEEWKLIWKLKVPKR
ncbi:uncharacterized protein LOC131598313 [Vicia villosa]|uniref:uncharacterized protein LOC131598313 n=1 Tax=Vicia villosa TaxID=3911 RepID=UPI00273C025C|nr:uncharacterized protein LOC131598313 [Vicia villosa]